MTAIIREKLLREASRLVPALRERAARTEQLRQLPPETVQELVSSGLVRLGNPERCGGYGLEPDLVYEIGWELGRACAATAWVYSLYAIHNWWVGHFPERAQEEFFAEGPDTISSSCINPAGARVDVMAEGFRISGRWTFSSGCDAATWATIAVPGARRGSVLWLLVPRSDFTIVDTWFASGMRGTGSKDVVIEEAFVPAHRSMDPDRAGDDDWTGWQVHRRVSYRAPMRAMVAWDLVAPIIGIAQGAVDELAGRLAGTTGPGRTADSVAMQLRLAESSAEVDAARAIHRSAVREILDRAGRGDAFSPADKARYRRDKSFAVRLCLSAVNRLFEGSGARAVMDGDPLQRAHRDIHGASHHAALDWDTAAELYGRALLDATSQTRA